MVNWSFSNIDLEMEKTHLRSPIRAIVTVFHYQFFLSDFTHFLRIVFYSKLLIVYLSHENAFQKSKTNFKRKKLNKKVQKLRTFKVKKLKILTTKRDSLKCL